MKYLKVTQANKYIIKYAIFSPQICTAPNSSLGFITKRGLKVKTETNSIIPVAIQKWRIAKPGMTGTKNQFHKSRTKTAFRINSTI